MIDFTTLETFLEKIENKEILGHTLGVWIFSLIVIIVGLIAAKIISRMAKRWSKNRFDVHGQNLLKKIVYYVIITIFVMVALNNLGVNFSGVLVAGGVLGIVLGFASQTVVSNLISGVFMYFDKPLKIGDYIIIQNEDISGVVTEIEILSTRIRTWDGNLVRIPNEKLFNSVIENRVSNEIRRIELIVGIAYKEDIGKAMDVIRGVLDEYPYVLVEPAPFMYVKELGSSSINIRILAWAPNNYAFQTQRELMKPIKEALDDEGIEIPFPQRDVWLRKKDS